MKVVIFCGGQGMRMRDYSDRIPKPLVPIGPRPILWHVMKYYAHHGHRDFILCLGHGGNQIKEYFLEYKDWLSNDLAIQGDTGEIQLAAHDLEEWTISFVDTGTNSCVGERLRRVNEYIDEDVFLCNYADCLTDVALSDVIEHHKRSGSVATFLAVAPSHSFHTVDMDEDGHVKRIGQAKDADVWVNGGYMVLNRKIFDYLNPGEELVEEPFARLAAEGLLSGYRYRGSWVGVDTFKELQYVEGLYVDEEAFWAVWRQGAPATSRSEG